MCDLYQDAVGEAISLQSASMACREEMHGDGYMDAVTADAVVDAERRSFGISSEALRGARRERLLTQLRLSEMSGVDVSTISQAESGARLRVRALTLARLSEALDVAPSELLVEPEAGAGEGG